MKPRPLTALVDKREDIPTTIVARVDQRVRGEMGIGSCSVPREHPRRLASNRAPSVVPRQARRCFRFAARGRQADAVRNAACAAARRTRRPCRGEVAASRPHRGSSASNTGRRPTASRVSAGRRILASDASGAALKQRARPSLRIADHRAVHAVVNVGEDGEWNVVQRAVRNEDHAPHRFPAAQIGQHDLAQTLRGKPV